MSLTEEPVRVYLYTVATAVVALLLGVGVVTSALAPLILGVVAAVLSVPSIELARSKVLPMAKLDRVQREIVEGRHDQCCQPDVVDTDTQHIEIEYPELPEGYERG